jgi:hypothetical protein
MRACIPGIQTWNLISSSDLLHDVLKTGHSTYNKLCQRHLKKIDVIGVLDKYFSNIVMTTKLLIQNNFVI